MQVEERAAGSSAFGTLLRRYRIAAGLSQEALAERARMSANGIGALERGYRRTPQRETLELLARALVLDDGQRAEFEAVAARPATPRREYSSVTVGPWPKAGTLALPLALTRFVGRDVELDEVEALVREHRMVTLTGTGGVGKTQMALRVATTLSDEGALRFVALAPIVDAKLVVTAIASALGVQEVPNHLPLAMVLGYLEGKTMLLILDNCEHVISEVAGLADALLLNCPGVRILATSREPLRTAGEYAYRLSSLTSSAAVSLFSDRARAVDHRFALSDENVPVVAEICRRLDGIPLAIELAAARVSALSVQALAERLDDRFRLLAGANRTALPQQQTMRATFEWSYNLLSPEEQRLFDRLSAFAGGCTLAMALAVCSEEGQDETQIFDLLSSLVDKSLIVADVSSGETRYMLLETTREYARERLAQRGESEAIAERLARVLLELGREFAGTETTYNARLDRPLDVLRTMRTERANFDEAMHWTLTCSKNTRLGQELAWRVPFLRATDALRWLSLALELADKTTPRALIVNLRIQLGWCLVDLRDHENAIVAARSAIAASPRLGEARLLAAARRLLGRALTHAWKLDEAEFELQQALATWRKLGDRRATASTLSYMAFVAFRRGAHSHARSLNLEALDALGDYDGRYARLIKLELARAEYGLGNYEVALAYSREAVPILEAEAAEGGLTCVILMLNHCSYLLACNGFGEAMEVALRALAAALDGQNPRPDLVPYVAGALAKIAVLSPDRETRVDRIDRLENCAKLIAWNEAVCTARGEADADETLEERSALRRVLGEDRLAVLFREGSRLDDGKAIELMQTL